MIRHSSFAFTGLVGLVLATAACGDKAPAGNQPGGAPDQKIAGTPATAKASGPAAAAPVKCDSYTDNLTDRDWAILYYAMTGLAPPREQWADQALANIDRNLGAEEAWKQANAQVEAQWNAVKDIRCVTLRTRADPQAYDASLGGMPLGAFSPETFFPFYDGPVKISLKFRNAEQARVWKMTGDKAAALKADNWLGNLGLSIRARLAVARPSGNGGTIEAEIVGFDLDPPQYSRITRETVTVTP